MLADSVSSYLVECYWPGIDDQELATATRRIEAAATQLRHASAHVWFLGSILMPADETVFCLFHGNEPAIRAVTQRASIPIERVVEWRWFDCGTQDTRPTASLEYRTESATEHGLPQGTMVPRTVGGRIVASQSDALTKSAGSLDLLARRATQVASRTTNDKENQGETHATA
jgi:hypothetical protein